MDTLKLTEQIKTAPVEKVFGASRLEDLDWVWLHRDLFADVVYLADENMEDEDVEIFLRMISDEDFLELLEPRMEERGFLAISAERFRKLDPTQKTFDGNTLLYVGRRFLMKKMIGFTNTYDWVLKAMALDLHSFSDNALTEVYKEYFEENGRILEQIAVTGEFEQQGYTWVLEADTDTMVSFYEGKVFSKWSSREAINTFDYKVRGGK